MSARLDEALRREELGHTGGVFEDRIVLANAVREFRALVRDAVELGCDVHVPPFLKPKDCNVCEFIARAKAALCDYGRRHVGD